MNRGVPNESVVRIVGDDLGLTRGEVQIVSREDVGPLASLLAIPESVEEVLVQFEVDRQGNDAVLVGGRGPGGGEWTIYYDTATIGL